MTVLFSRGELRKKVFLSDSRKESLKIGDTKPLYKLRLSIERIFGIGKQWHRLSKAIYRGVKKVFLQSCFTFLAMNLRKLVIYQYGELTSISYDVYSYGKGGMNVVIQELAYDTG